MIEIPQEITRLGQAVRAINAVVRFCRIIRPIPGVNTKTEVTEGGTSISAVMAPASADEFPRARIVLEREPGSADIDINVDDLPWVAEEGAEGGGGQGEDSMKVRELTVLVDVDTKKKFKKKIHVIATEGDDIDGEDIGDGGDGGGGGCGDITFPGEQDAGGGGAGGGGGDNNEGGGGSGGFPGDGGNNDDGSGGGGSGGFPGDGGNNDDGSGGGGSGGFPGKDNPCW